MNLKFILPFILGLVLFSIAQASAVAIWDSYGYNNSLSQAQPLEHSKLNLGTATSSVSFGYQVENPISYLIKYTNNYIYRKMQYEPLIASLGDNKNYLFFPEGTNMDFYYSNSTILNLAYQMPTGFEPNSQIALTDWNKDGIKDDIAGIWNINTTFKSFQVFNFNYTGQTLSLIYQENFTTDASEPITGVTCTQMPSKECFFIKKNNSLNNIKAINSTSSRNIILPNATYYTSSSFLEPIAMADTDADGKEEYLAFSVDNLMLRDNDLQTNRIFYLPYSNLDNSKILDAKIIKSSSGTSKIAVLEVQYSNSINPQYWELHLKLLSSNYPSNATPATIYDKIVYSSSESGGSGNYMGVDGKLAIGRDYNADGYQDIYVAEHDEHYKLGTQQTNTRYLIYRGYDGILLWDNTSPGYSGGAVDYYIQSFTLGDMNNNNYDDFIIMLNNGKINVIDSYANTTIFSASLSSKYSCLPADLAKTGNLALICAGLGTGGTTSLISSITDNSAPIINSIIFTPAIIVAVNNPLYAEVLASDADLDTIYYSKQCQNGEDWSANQTNNILSCTYNETGLYSFTFGVSDLFHGYTTYTQEIMATSEGFICNNDGYCNATAGETIINCPNDCGEIIIDNSMGRANFTSLDLVDVANPTQGLLPDIYYGVLAFMSWVIVPLLVIGLCFGGVMVILAIGWLFVSLADKIGGR